MKTFFSVLAVFMASATMVSCHPHITAAAVLPRESVNVAANNGEKVRYTLPELRKTLVVIG